MKTISSSSNRFILHPLRTRIIATDNFLLASGSGLSIYLITNNSPKKMAGTKNHFPAASASARYVYVSYEYE